MLVFIRDCSENSELPEDEERMKLGPFLIKLCVCVVRDVFFFFFNSEPN